MARSKGIAWALLLTVVTVAVMGCGKQQVLFNGTTFSGWTAHADEPGVDPWSIWSIEDGVIRSEGKPNGYIRTVDVYTDFKLHLEWRWVAEPTNSGVLLRAGGPDKVWPRCIEAQLKAGDAGDFVLIGHPGATVNGVRYQDDNQMYVVIPGMVDGLEKTPGQWNAYDIECIGDTITLRVNNRLINQATRVTDLKGWICLQSEGSPIEFRNIVVTRLE
ncbi:MAG: DUF1080 domain-containing protein [Sedimentisphaerales bacterium]|nr:DUF1080 domain-containing protein [Sedimentisphaerales bacterium]